MAVATDLSSRAFSALGPFASKEFRSRPSCAISLRGTVVVNAAVSVRRRLLAWCAACVTTDVGEQVLVCVCARTTSQTRTSYFSVLLPAYTAFDHESLNLFSARPEVHVVSFQNQPTRHISPLAFIPFTGISPRDVVIRSYL